MKVVLLALSGDSSRWHDKLVQLYPDSSIETISRAEFETGNHLKRLKSLRALRPDVLVIATERLPWQRGQNLFMIFGALAGAREVLMIDAHGGQLRRSRANLLLGAPARLSRETLTSANDVAQSRRELQRLEQEVMRTKGESIARLRSISHASCLSASRRRDQEHRPVELQAISRELLKRSRRSELKLKSSATI